MKNKLLYMGKKVKEKRRNAAHKKILTVLCVLFALYTVSLAFPFLWMLINSFKNKNDFFDAQWALPSQLMFLNYVEVFKIFNIGEMFANSLIVCVGCSTLSLLSTSFAAYALSKFKFKLNKLFYLLALSVMLFPIAGGLASTYKLMQDLMLFDTHIGLILMSASGFGMNFLLLYAYYRNISDTYIEAATVDGAGNWRTFLQIVMPQAKGISATLWVLGFIGMWNNFDSVFIFLPSYQTISTGIKYISDNITTGEYALDYPKYFAAILITTVPMLIMFFCFQKSIMNVSLGGGIKG